MRRLRVATLLPALVLAGATVASPFAGTTTARLAADHSSTTVHAAPLHAPRLSMGSGQQAPKQSPASTGVHWKMPVGSIVVLTFAYAAFGGLAGLLLMLIARRRGRKVSDAIPQPWEFWRGMTKPIRTHGMHRRGSVR